MDCPLREELLRKDCRDWVLGEDWREGLLSDRCKEAEFREFGREWLLMDV